MSIEELKMKYSAVPQSEEQEDETFDDGNSLFDVLLDINFIHFALNWQISLNCYCSV